MTALVGCSPATTATPLPQAIAPTLVAVVPTAAPQATLPAPAPGVPPTALPTTRPKLNVLTTVEPLLNIVLNIGGDRITLDGVVPPGTDSHTFEPVPSDAVRMSRADVIFINGLQLEEPTRKLAEKNLKAGAEIVLLGEQTVKPDQFVFDFSFPKEDGKPNPHLWMNPIYALRYADIVRETLSKRDAANASYYGRNYEAFKLRIDALDKGIRETIQSIPEANRRLLTYHDSFAYFAPRYGMTVIGAIQPNDFKEPSAREVAALITQLRKEKVPAIFGSEVFPTKLLEQIKKESGVEFVDTLSDDALPGDLTAANHTYIGMLVDDVITMARVLGGKSDAILKVNVTNSYARGMSQ